MNTTSDPSSAAIDSLTPGPRFDGCHRFSPLRIAAIVVGFLVFWPIGLALLIWTLWRDQIKASGVYRKIAGCRPERGSAHLRRAAFRGRRPSNSALAAYLETEQQRLQAEQEKLAELVKAFEAFKEAESRSADKRDFEAFLKQRDGEPGQEAG